MEVTPSADGQQPRPLEVEMTFSLQRIDALLRLPDGINQAVVAEAAQALGLTAKTELHITVIGSKTANMISTHLALPDTPQKDDIVPQIANLFLNYPWVVTPTSDYYILQKTYPGEPPETRQTIVQMVHIHAFEVFYAQLSRITGLAFEVPLTHVTLFSTSTNPDKITRGIGVYSPTQFWGELNPQRIEANSS